MQFKNIARTLVCVSLALAAHSAFASATDNQCNGKLCSSYIAGGGLVDITVEDLSRNPWLNVVVHVFQCTSNALTAACVEGRTDPPQDLSGGEKDTFHRIPAPPNFWYFIKVTGIFNGKEMDIVYSKALHVLPA